MGDICVLFIRTLTFASQIQSRRDYEQKAVDEQLSQVSVPMGSKASLKAGVLTSQDVT